MQGSSAALPVQLVVDHIGINHHLDFGSEPSVDVAAAAVVYAGIGHLRDCADNPNTLGPTGTWQRMADATGAKICAFMTEGSVAAMTRDLPWAVQLAGQGILELLEGGNENDNKFATDAGNSIALTKAFQQQVFDAGRALGIPVVNMSFGSGWTAANKWEGDYDKVGDMSDVCDFANAHTYPQQAGRPTGVDVTRLRDLAHIAASLRQCIHTEMGWKGDQFAKDFASIGRWALFGLFDSLRDGNFRLYYYAIFDDGSGNYGFFEHDGTPRPAATAIHNLTTILADSGAPRSDTLAYDLAGAMPNDNVLLLQRSNGTFLFVIWNESTDAAHSVTITLGASVGWSLYDPTVSAGAIPLPADIAATVMVGDRPVILEAASASAIPAPPPVTDPPPVIVVVPPPVTDPAPPPPPPPPLDFPPPVTDPPPPVVVPPVVVPPVDGVPGGPAPPPVVVPPVVVPPVVVPPPPVQPPPVQPPTWNFPTSLVSGGMAPLAGISISDPWAAPHTGKMALNLSTSKGTLAAFDANGVALPGSGTAAIHFSGTFAQVNAVLATLALTLAGTGLYALTFDIYNQAGKHKSQTIPITIQ